MDYRLPELGEGVYEAELVAWLVKVGDTVKRGQNLMEVLTDKATMEVPASFTGTITQLNAESGQQIKVGDVVLTYTSTSQQDGPASADDGAQKAENQPAEVPARDAVRLQRPETTATRQRATALATPVLTPSTVRAAPSVRLLARKLGIDLTRIQGSGPGGRILLEDISTHIQPGNIAPRQPAVEPVADYGTPGTRIKLQGIRRKIADHMALAKRTIPHYTYVDECDVTELVWLRESLKETYTRAGVKLTYLAFFVKAVAAALKEVPIANSSLDEAAGEIILHDRYHIGIAVATPNGLIVPVIRDADHKDLAQIAREVERLSSDARTGKVRLKDLRGGTFTITSIGSIGGLISTPVINHPEVAILGIGKVVKRPVYDATGNIRPADLLYLSLSCDHRVLDGAVGAAFGNAIMRRLLNPATLLLSEKII
jgi:pyruvate dehydrogenase E2 component (dihydrolipoamide acetyltransferase)/2-oxoisovalerate dehydrogenase E2 component (dihydrolipoyl transacylase)